MKKLFNTLIVLSAAAFLFVMNGCGGNTECDDCMTQKAYYCQAMHDNNCNSASLTFYTDQLITACGKSEAEAYIAKASQECMDKVLLCNNCD